MQLTNNCSEYKDTNEIGRRGECIPLAKTKVVRWLLGKKGRNDAI